MSKINKFDILGTQVSLLTYDLSLKIIYDQIIKNESHFVCVAAVHLIMEAYRDRRFQLSINKSLMTTTDGMPLVWLSHSDRIYGPDLMLALCCLAERNKFKIFLLGGAKGEGKQLRIVLSQRFPKLTICGDWDTPTRPLSQNENSDIIQIINSTDAQIVFVGMGCPLQEKWMIENYRKLDHAVCVGVGAAFDFISSREKQAPVWMQKRGFEWFFRLWHQPRRLAYRYIVYNSWFVLLIIRQIFYGYIKSDLNET